MYKIIEKWKDSGKNFNFKGNNIFYLQQGDGDDLLIIHGYPFSSFEWEDTIKELSKLYRVTIFDLLGMGFSDKPKKHKYSFEEYCDIVNELLNELRITETHILSHDLGVSVVQELIARDSEKINNFKILSSAFVNGSLFIDVYKPRFIQRLLSQSPKIIGKLLSKALTKKMVNRSVKSVFGPNTKPTDYFLNLQWEILNYNDGKSITYLIGRLVFDKYYYLNRWISKMQNTKIPMCYICGPYDPNSGLDMVNRYVELIPNSKIYLLEKDIGHWPYLEDQEAFLSLYLKFIKSIIPIELS
jgi:pimeloyl-ACP methyl ester carboxylesterase